MRIAVVTSGGFDPTGQGRVIPALLWLVERLARRHDVQVFQLHNSGGPTEYEAYGARVVELRDRPGPWRKWRALAAAMRRAGPFDVVHGYWAAPAGLAAAVAGRRLGVPSIVTLDSGELSALPPARPDALAEAIAALAGDPERRVRLADAARVWALDRDADRTTMMMEALYARCRPVEP